MKWTRSLQMRNAKHDACTQMQTRSPATVPARMCALPTCPTCIASWLLELHDIGIKFNICIMHKILNSNNMEKAQRTFGEMLRMIFRNPKQDIWTQRGSPDRTEYDDDNSFKLKEDFVSCLKSKNETFFTLTDKNGLSILGYSLLTCKSGIIHEFCAYFNETDKIIAKFVTDNLNKELAFVIRHRVYEIVQYADNLVKLIFQIQQKFKSFKLSDDNAKLVGFRMVISEFNSLNTKTSNKVMVPPDNVEPFTIPTDFVPRVAPPSSLPPPPGPDWNPPPPPFPPHVQQWNHPPPPPPYFPGPPPPPFPGPPSTPHPPFPGPPPPPFPGLQQYHIPPGPPPHPMQQWNPPPPPGPPPGQPYQQYRYGGTRKNHKRHKKQIRKHASKKIKHDK